VVGAYLRNIATNLRGRADQFLIQVIFIGLMR
jgi:hypothetical protein